MATSKSAARRTMFERARLGGTGYDQNLSLCRMLATRRSLPATLTARHLAAVNLAVRVRVRVRVRNIECGGYGFVAVNKTHTT